VIERAREPAMGCKGRRRNRRLAPAIVVNLMDVICQGIEVDEGETDKPAKTGGKRCGAEQAPAKRVQRCILNGLDPVQYPSATRCHAKAEGEAKTGHPLVRSGSIDA
jgi:hypothetical protein